MFWGFDAVFRRPDADAVQSQMAALSHRDAHAAVGIGPCSMGRNQLCRLLPFSRFSPPRPGPQGISRRLHGDSHRPAPFPGKGRFRQQIIAAAVRAAPHQSKPAPFQQGRPAGSGSALNPQVYPVEVPADAGKDVLRPLIPPVTGAGVQLPEVGAGEVEAALLQPGVSLQSGKLADLCVPSGPHLGLLPPAV